MKKLIYYNTLLHFVLNVITDLAVTNNLVKKILKYSINVIALFLALNNNIWY